MPKPIEVILSLALIAACTQRPSGSTISNVRPPPPGFPTAPYWWGRVMVKATDSTIQGVPLAAIDTSWARASTLTLDLLPPDAAGDSGFVQDFREGHANFTISGDFNKDGIPDRAMVGVYTTHSGETGRFLLILTSVRDKGSKEFLATEPGTPGFSILTRRDSLIDWYECLYCDFSVSFTWNGTTFVHVSSSMEEQ
jgi:hypothetical protein